MLTSMVLWRCALVALLAAVLTESRSLRFRASGVAQAPTLHPRSTESNPCMVWLQEHAGQTASTDASQAPPPCPCLNTPPPLMSPEQLHATQVGAAADEAMMQGMARIRAAAVEAAAPIEAELQALQVVHIEKAAQDSLYAAEQNQTANLQAQLAVEKARQEREMAEMENGANMVAKVSADHIRETTEQWAENQARTFMFASSSGPLSQAVEEAHRTEKLRQEATELTKGAIDSAAQALDVAKKAQAAIDMAPDKAMIVAKEASKDSKEKQKVLNSEIEHIEETVRNVARQAKAGYEMAERTWEEANVAEIKARKALEQSRENAKKIEKMKTRATAVENKAKEAKEKLEGKR